MMGAGLAKAAYAAADALAVRDHAPVRAYVFMALTALDSDSAPMFFGGRESLAAALSAPRTPNGFKTVKDATRTLVQHGLITVKSKGAPGRPTKYALLDGEGSPLALNRAPLESPGFKSGHGERPVYNTEQGTFTVATGYVQPPQQGTPNVPPKEEEEYKEETRPPTRSCKRHSNWEHNEPCRGCAADRRAAEALTRIRRPSTMSERREDCGTANHKRLPDGTCLFCEHREFERTA